MLNKQKGDMYKFINFTWNTVKGKCPHDCSYCYMKVFPQGLLHFDEDELKIHLGSNNFIFVGSSCDMWAEIIPDAWIKDTLQHCQTFNENTYLFQTKNPARYEKFREQLEKLRPNVILGTTIETDRNELLKGNAPSVEQRAIAMELKGFRKMVTIEPAIEFNVTPLVEMIERINPEFVNIGADSKSHHLVEPSWFKITQLVKGLERFTQVNLKDNLNRLKDDNL